MSFISVAVFANYISIMSDGRVSNMNDIKREVIREDFKKFFHVDKNTILGVAGHLDTFTMLKDKYENHQEIEIEQLKIELRNTIFGEMAFLRDTSGNPVKILAVLCGKDSKGKMFASTYLQRNVFQKDEKHYNGESVFICIGSVEPEEDLTDLFNRKFAMLQKTLKNDKLAVYRAQKEINDYIASITDDVNTNIFCETIS